MAHVFRMLHRVSQFLATLPRAGQQPGTSENSVTFAAPKYVPDRGMMTRLGHRRVLPKAIVVLLCKPRHILPGFRYRVTGLAGKWQAQLFRKPVGISN